MPETILIVDDEAPVRQTFLDWLGGAGLDCEILVAADAESALLLANQHAVDLAILDWNLGAGHDGLHLLEDLFLFHPDIVAIMVTGYAHQATPLDAMRMGVRDYLDKNQDLNRDTFLTAVTRQLERIRPAKRERLLHRSLIAFREAVSKVIPLVQSAAALNDPVPLSEAVHALLRFLIGITRSGDGVLLARSHDPSREPAEIFRAYDSSGSEWTGVLASFSRSVAGTAVSMQKPCVMAGDELANAGAIELQPFERGRHSLLAAPLSVAPGIQVVLELFDKRSPGGDGTKAGYTDEDQRLVAATAEFGVELLRQALAERHSHQMLFDAVAAALGASESVAQALQGASTGRLEPPPAAVLDSLREGLRASPGARLDADATLRLAEAIRVLALRHGDPALRHCITLVESLRQLLDVSCS